MKTEECIRIMLEKYSNELETKPFMQMISTKRDIADLGFVKGLITAFKFVLDEDEE